MLAKKILRVLLTVFIRLITLPYTILGRLLVFFSRIPRIGYEVLNCSHLSIIKKCKVKNENIKLDCETPMELWRAVTYEYKEPETLEWIRLFFKKGDVFYDVGANIGVYSLYACKKGAKVYAFEPESLNYAKLNKNIKLNNLSGKILPCCIALSLGMAIKPFFVRDFKAGESAHGFDVKKFHLDQEFVPQHEQGMLGMSIDEVTKFLEFPDHIKIDVDGTEKNIVKGMKETLKNPRLKSVLIEISKTEYDGEIEDIFYQCRFKLWNKLNRDKKTQNYIFIRE